MKYALPKKVEKVVKFHHKLWKNGGKTLTWALAFFIIGILAKSSWDGYWKTHMWTWRTPVIFQTPLIIKELKPREEKAISPVSNEKTSPTPVPEANLPLSEEELVKSLPHGKELWAIYALESGRGANDMCRKTGKGYNGLGLGESDEYIARNGANCFPTLEALWNRAEKLIVELGIDQNEATAVCAWKYGPRADRVNCEYYQKFLSIR